MSQYLGKDKIKVFQFLQEIGIEYHTTLDQFDSFLPGVKIERGKLMINLNNLISIGDVLHEAGHLACLPSQLRNSASGDLTVSLGPEYTYEMGAMLWSVAAAYHIQISLKSVFHDLGYKGDSAWLLQLYQSGNYLGLPLLQFLGLAYYDEEIESGLGKSFPTLKKWLRD